MKKGLRVLAGLLVGCILATVPAFALTLEYPASPARVYTTGENCVVDWITEVAANRASWTEGSHSDPKEERTLVEQTEAVWKVDTDGVAYLSMTNKHDGARNTYFRDRLTLKNTFDFTEAVNKNGYIQMTYRISGPNPNLVNVKLMNSTNYKEYIMNMHDPGKYKNNEWITVKVNLSDISWKNGNDTVDKSKIYEINFDYEAPSKGDEEYYQADFDIKELAVYVPDNLQIKGPTYDGRITYAENGWQWNGDGTGNDESSYSRDEAGNGKPKRFTFDWKPTAYDGNDQSKGRKIVFDKPGSAWNLAERENLDYFRITFRLDVKPSWFVLQFCDNANNRYDIELHDKVVANRWIRVDVPLKNMRNNGFDHTKVTYFNLRYKDGLGTSSTSNTKMEFAEFGIFSAAPKFELSNFRIQKDGVDTVTYAAGDTLTVAGDMYNSGAQKDFVVISALYDEGNNGKVLKSAQVTPVSAAAYSGDTAITNVSFTVPQTGGEGTTFKAYAFDGTENIVPLTDEAAAATKAQ